MEATRLGRCYPVGTMVPATKAALYDLVDELPDDRIETARRFLRSLRRTDETSSFLARFITTMGDSDAALLDGLAALDRDDGAPTKDLPDSAE